MKSLAHQYGDASDDTAFDDTPTGEIDPVAPLGALVAQPAIAIDAATPIAIAAQLLVHHRVPALAVVERDQLRGVVTRTDVLRALDQPSRAGREQTAADIMSSFVIALPASATVERAAALMAYEGVGQVIVTGPRGQLVGMVSAVDLARHFAARAGYLHAES